MSKFYFHITEWKKAPFADLLVCQAVGSVWLKSKGGRLLFGNYVLNSTITRAEIVENEGNVDDLKRAKEEFLRERWEPSMLEIKEIRTGVKGYRGYFKIVEVLPIQHPR